jgi:hypothetical protein
MNYSRPQILTEKNAGQAIHSIHLKDDDTVDNMTSPTTKTTPAAYEADE